MRAYSSGWSCPADEGFYQLTRRVELQIGLQWKLISTLFKELQYWIAICRFDPLS